MNIGVQYTFDPLPVGDLSIRFDYTYKSGQVFGPDPIASPFDDQIASKNQNNLDVHVTLARIPTGLTTDQRDGTFDRISGAAVDIGAFEVQPPKVTDRRSRQGCNRGCA